MEGIKGKLGGKSLELLEEVIQVYIERKEWFGELILQHMTLSAIAIFFAGVIGLLIGMWIAEHNRVAPVILGIANVFYTIPSISPVSYTHLDVYKRQYQCYSL